MLSTEIGSLDALERISEILRIVFAVSAISCASASLSAWVSLGYLDVASGLVDFLFDSLQSFPEVLVLFPLLGENWHFVVFRAGDLVDDRADLADQQCGLEVVFFSVLLDQRLERLVLALQAFDSRSRL